VAWELLNGPVPGGMHVCHSCDNPPCCNPAHLFLGTAVDNAADREAKGRGNHASGDRCASRLYPGIRKGALNGRARLDEWAVCGIMARLLQGETQAGLARAYGVSHPTVNGIATGRTWGHLFATYDQMIEAG